MEDMVIPDVMNEVFLPQGRYPENFVLISRIKYQVSSTKLKVSSIKYQVSSMKCQVSSIKYQV